MPEKLDNPGHQQTHSDHGEHDQWVPGENWQRKIDEVLKMTFLYGAMDAETGREVRRSMYHEEQNRDYTNGHVNVTSGNSTKLTKGDAMDISHVPRNCG